MYGEDECTASMGFRAAYGASHGCAGVSSGTTELERDLELDKPGVDMCAEVFGTARRVEALVVRM